MVLWSLQACVQAVAKAGVAGVIAILAHWAMSNWLCSISSQQPALQGNHDII